VWWQDPTGRLPALAPHWPELKDFFLKKVGVAEEPKIAPLVEHFLQLAESGGPPDPDNLRELARRIAANWGGLDPSMQERLKTARWPGVQGASFAWFEPQRLVINDRPRLARLFGNRLAVWALAGLEELARKLGIEPLSRKVSPQIYPSGRLRYDEGLSEKVALLWPVITRFTRTEEPVPEVFLVGGLSVVHRMGDLTSEAEPLGAHYDRQDKRLLLTEEAAEDPGPAVAEALAREFGDEALRAFVVEVWGCEPGSTTFMRRLERWARERETDFADLLTVAEIRHRRPGGPETRRDAAERVAVVPAAPRPFPPEEGRWEPGKRARPARPLGDHRAEVARRAMSRVEAWLKGQGYEVWDVSGYGLGYDLEAFRDGVTIQVEVKGLSLPDRVTFTPHEWEQARKFGDRYWLVVAVIYGEDSGLYLIRDPARKLRPEIEERAEIYYQLPRPQWLEASERLETGPDGP
jgi:hypothetical protein